MKLQLEYCCTETETNEAQALLSHRQPGRGPKWRSRVVYYAFLVLAAVGLYFRFKREIAPRDRAWFIALAVVVFIALHILQRFSRAKSDQSLRLEISDRELVFIDSASHTAKPWSAFSQCFESPTVFALLDRSRQLLYTVPKRAFPDEASQNWFRALANQPSGVRASLVSEASIAGRSVAKGITLTVQWKYRDYVIRMVTSWRTKGIALGIIGFAIVTCLFGATPPDAVNSRSETLIIMLAMMTPMLAVVLFVVSFVAWRSGKNYVTAQEVALTDEGIEFAGDDGTGFLQWTAYKYYLENRWSFFVWNPRASVWFMFPKRQFASPLDLDQCRELLQKNLRRSRWFFL
jgi:hypothetical protein